jgi:hypothetical protein
LGETDGAPIEVEWAPPSKVPSLLPWIVLLALLALKRNRTPDAWYVLAPVILIVGLDASRNLLANMMDPDGLDMFLVTGRIMILSLAAMWLLLPWLKSAHPIITLSKTIPLLSVVSIMMAFGGRGRHEMFGTEFLLLLLLSGMLGVALPLVLMLSGWRCKHRYSPWRFLVWTTIWSFAGAALVLIPLAVIAIISSSSPPFLELLAALGICTAVIIGLLLPFLILSFVNAFHRDRFRSWLRSEAPDAPPVVPVEQETMPAQ